MTEKRFKLKPYDGIRCDVFDGEIEIAEVHRDDAKGLIDLLNALHEENVKLKNSLKEFEVFESNRINGGVVTNDDFSVTLHNNNEAYMVCNMLNRFIRSVKNGDKD